LNLKPLNEPISTQPDRPRYAEMRVYHIRPGKLDIALEQLDEPLVALKRRHGLSPQAYWVSLDASAEAPVVVELLAPPSAASSREAWRAMEADSEYPAIAPGADNALGEFTSRIETVRLVAPADAWSLAGNPRRPFRVFDLRLYTGSPGKEDAFRQRWHKHAARIYERHGMDNLGWWEATDAEHPRIFMTLLAHESLDAVNTTIEKYHQDSEWIAIEKESESDGPLRSGVLSYKLVPASFSPLK
jgi:hypothetical protein